jgi:hypothetical protein
MALSRNNFLGIETIVYKEALRYDAVRGHRAPKNFANSFFWRIFCRLSRQKKRRFANLKEVLLLSTLRQSPRY